MSEDEHKIKFAGGVLDQLSMPTHEVSRGNLRFALKAIRAIRAQYGPIKVISRPRSGQLVKTENSKHIDK